MQTQLAKDMARKVFAVAGLEISRARPKLSNNYYPTVDSCQVQNLSHLLELFLDRREDGIFVEVGAYDGITYSNTWGLATRGWRGILIEPVPHLAERSRRNHSGHPFVEVVEQAAGSEASSLELHLAGPYTTADSTQASEFAQFEQISRLQVGQSITVSQDTLDSILSRANVQEGFDLLVVDVEGHEDAVFAGFSLPRWSPKMLIVELENAHPLFTANRAAHARLEKRIGGHGYRTVYKDAVNTVLVRDDVADLAYLSE